jgi:hypothetical protein
MDNTTDVVATTAAAATKIMSAGHQREHATRPA